MKTIVVGTMGRSGSTLLVKIIISYLKLNGFNVNGTTKIATWPKNKISNDVDFNVIKLHKSNKNFEGIANYTLTCVRDIREVIASTKKYIGDFQKGGLDNNVKDQLRYYNYWIGKSDYCFRYEDYVYNGLIDYEKYIESLSNVLGIDKVDIKDLENMVIEDNKNGFHKVEKHVTSKKLGVNEYKDILSKDEISLIEIMSMDFLKKNNYL